MPVNHIARPCFPLTTSYYLAPFMNIFAFESALLPSVNIQISQLSFAFALTKCQQDKVQVQMQFTCDHCFLFQIGKCDVLN